MRVCIETYGCTMNQGESLELEQALFKLGFELVDSCEDADISVINTCAVIKATELKILKRMRRLDAMGKGLVITGCMAAVMRPEVEREFPGALIVAPLDYDDFYELFRQRYGTGRALHFPSKEYGVTAIVPIAQGCLSNCTYCLTKLARGTLESRSMDKVVASVQRAVDMGSGEILMTAQDTGCYGLDIGSDLVDLLEKVVKVKGEFKVRVGMMSPESLPGILDRLVGTFHNDKIYKFLHLPVQTGSDRILEAMGRGYSVAGFEEQVAAFRAEHPRLTLSTDVITGFPGERQEDHDLTVSLIKRVRPNIVNVTRFSARPGTPADKMPGQIVSRISKERSREMAKVRFEVASELNRARVGERVMVMVTEVGKGSTVICRDDHYAPVVVRDRLPLGSRVNVEITGSQPTHLFGKVVRETDVPHS
jgi:MiaB-like tRNA modifying enzyme